MLAVRRKGSFSLQRLPWVVRLDSFLPSALNPLSLGAVDQWNGESGSLALWASGPRQSFSFSGFSFRRCAKRCGRSSGGWREMRAERTKPTYRQTKSSPMLAIITTPLLLFGLFSNSAWAGHGKGGNHGSHGSGGSSSEEDPDWYLKPSVNWDAPTVFCTSPSDFVLPPVGAAEIILSPTTPDGEYVSYVGTPLPAGFFASWPTNLDTNPTCPTCATGPFSKNLDTARNILASGICTWRSPNVADAACLANPATCRTLITYYPPAPYTPPVPPQQLAAMRWFSVATCHCVFAYPDTGVPVTVSTVPPAGHVFATLVDKANVLWWAAGRTIYSLIDEWGNKYIMHASVAQVAPENLDVSQVVLPPRWRLEKSVLTSDFSIHPMGWNNADGSQSTQRTYVIVRDNAGFSYHQYSFGNKVNFNPHGNHNSNRNLFSVIATNPSCITRLSSWGALTTTEPSSESSSEESQSSSHSGSGSDSEGRKRLRG